jgi:phenylacetate-coenzyme A ligase PaaK-like adenylate-forming protein
MASWDRRTPAQRSKLTDAAVRRQVVDAVAPFSPWWRDRLKTLGRKATAVASVEGLSGLPAVGERDVCADGDPRGMAALVLQGTESGFALHAEGPTLRRALVRRLGRSGSYQSIVEADTRPTSFVWAGLGLRYPVASTRSDLDLVARAGARLWQLLGLTRADVVVSALPTTPTAATQALELGALGAGSPLLAPGDVLDDVAGALRLVPATVLALPAASAAQLLDDLHEAGAELSTLTTVLLIGAAYDDERAAVREALQRVGVAASCTVLAAHVPDGHRLLWAECRPSGGKTGLHTYPDLELVQLVDPETGEAGSGRGPFEVVLTQLGFRGSALLRWRTGDLADALVDEPCTSCGRTVPRLVGLRQAALVPPLELRGGLRPVDVRGVAAALVGRADISDWRIVLGRSARDDADELLVHVVPAGGTDPADVAVAVARDIRAAAGLLPTQVVVAESGELPTGGAALGARVLSRQ